MKTGRLLIASFVFLATGIGLLFGYCHGSTGFSIGYPMSGTALKLDITTTGLPALSGFLLTLGGLALLIVAVIAALVAEIRSARPKAKMQPHADLVP